MTNNKAILFQDEVLIYKQVGSSGAFIRYYIYFGTCSHEGDGSTSDFYIQVFRSVPDGFEFPSGDVDLSGVEIKLYSINL